MYLLRKPYHIRVEAAASAVNTVVAISPAI
jgi:hypothetical protein